MAKNLKIKKTSAADLVCRKMRELIVDGTWAINEKIPSEADLAENFGVNRLTVRIALQRLNALGVLETRVGEGTFVRSFDFDKHLAEISDFYVNDKVMDDVLEFRGIIELAAAKLAVKRWQGDDLTRVRGCCEAFEEELKRFYSLSDQEQKHQSFIQTVDIGLALQCEIVKLSRNALINFAFSIAKDPIRKHMMRNALTRINDPRSDHSKVWVKAYWDLYEGLKNRDESATLDAFKRVINLKAPTI